MKTLKERAFEMTTEEIAESTIGFLVYLSEHPMKIRPEENTGPIARKPLVNDTP